MLWWPLEIARYKKWCFERKYASNLTCCGESNKTKYSVLFPTLYVNMHVITQSEKKLSSEKWCVCVSGSLREVLAGVLTGTHVFFLCFCVCACTSFVMITLSVSPGGQATPLNLRVSARPRSPESMACSWATERAAWAPISYQSNPHP